MAGGGRFTGGSNPAVGASPLGVAVGDVDGDGDLDLLSANYGAGTVSVRLNGGDATGTNTGTFSGTQNVAVGSGPYSVILADVDGDGDLDLLAANQNSNTISIRLNGGNNQGTNTGVFSGSQNVAVGGGPNLVVAGDIDGDGDLDLLTTTYYNGTVSVRLNGGNSQGTTTGVFTAPAAGAEVAVGYGPTALLLADVDGDGDLDLLVPKQDNTVSVRLNGGNNQGTNTGVFGGSQEVAVGNNPLGAAVGDVDGDGDLDVVTANSYANSLSVRLNGGDASGTNTGVFSNGSTVSVGSSPSSVALGDVDGDGDLDALTANQNSGTVSVRLNGGDASGQNRGTFVAPAATNGPEVAVGSRPSYVQLADADGDGDLDLFTANYYSNSVSVRLNQAALPVITSFTPALGPIGGSIALNGASLQGATAITFTGSGATTVTSGFTVSSNGAQLTGVVVPAGAATGPVSVALPAGTVTSTVSFTVVPSPTVTDFTLGSGQIGTSLTITGTNLGGATAITFAGTSNNSVSGGYTINSAGTQITGIAVPLGAATGPLSVTTPGGTATSTASFTVVPAPYILSFTPGRGVAGTAVQVQGANLGGLSSLLLNGVDATASVRANTGTSLTFTVPAGAPPTGTTSVSAAAGTGTSQGFEVQLRVLASQPAANARAAARLNSAVALTLSEAVTAASAPGLRVYSAQRGGRRAGAVSVGGAGVSFAASGGAGGAGADFVAGELVSVSAPATVRSAGGVALARRVWQFTTATAGTGRGVFRPGSTLAAGLSAVVAGDLDGDGDLDIVAGSSGIKIYRNGRNGTGTNVGTFSTTPDTSIPIGATDIALGDVDGDGDLDIAASSGIGSMTVSILLNGGDNTGSNTGIFGSAATVTVGIGASDVELADVDGDGDLDLLCACALSNSVTIRLNGGDAGGSNAGVFYNGSNVSCSPSTQTVTVGDVDGDGDLDLLATSYPANEVVVRLNGGDASGSNTGLFTNGSAVTLGSLPNKAELGDVDGDGDLDLLAATSATNSVSVRLNGGDASGSNTGVFSNGTTVAVGANPQFVRLGDVDADGDLDFVVSNQDANSVSVLLNGGDASGSGTGIFSTPATLGTVAVSQSPYALSLHDLDNDGDLDLLATGSNNSLSIRLTQEATLASTAPARLAAEWVVTPTVTDGRELHYVYSGAPWPAPATVAIYTLTGQVVSDQRVLQASGTIAVKGLATGWYVARLTTTTGMNATRFYVP